jgi:hypothetical protein
MGDVAPVEPIEHRPIHRPVVLAHDVGEDAPIGASGELDAVEGPVVADLIGTGAVHRAPAGAPRQHQRAVNIEKNEVHYAAEAEP